MTDYYFADCGMCGQYKKVTVNTTGRFDDRWLREVVSRKRWQYLKLLSRRARHERMMHGKHHKGKGLK